MQIRKAYKYRIYPTKEQQDKLTNMFGINRFVYNYYLRKRIDHYAETGKGLNYYNNVNDVVKLKKEEGFEWIQNAPAQTLQQTLADLDSAYHNFFSKRAKFPKFKKKHGKQSIRYPQDIKVKKNQVFLPKVGWTKIVLHRQLEGVMKNMTVSKTRSDKYYASIQVEQDIDDPVYQGNMIGVDLGLKDFIVTSNNDRYENPRHLRKSEKKLKRLQRKLSKTKRGSNGRAKARLRLARQHEKVSNQRNDSLHKLSRQLIEENQLIVVEDLSVKNMLSNRKLAKSISDAGWSEFVRQLEYKGIWYGCHVENIDRFFPSSKRCFECGWINQDLKLSDREWVCRDCGCILDRDLNAAKNILNWYTVGTTGINASGENVRPDCKAVSEKLEVV